MEFSNYYRSILEGTGVPNLSLDQHKRLFNIIHYEGQLKRIEAELKQFGYNSTTSSYKRKIERKIEKLFNGHTHPASVFGEMLAKSNVP